MGVMSDYLALRTGLRQGPGCHYLESEDVKEWRSSECLTDVRELEYHVPSVGKERKVLYSVWSQGYHFTILSPEGAELGFNHERCQNWYVHQFDRNILRVSTRRRERLHSKVHGDKRR